LLSIGVRLVLKAVIFPPGGPLWLGLAGLLTWRRRPRLSFALCAAGILSLWVLSTPFIADFIDHASEDYPPLDVHHLPASAAHAGAIVILGGGVRFGAPEVGADAPSPPADLRLIEGARVARATHLPILVSGTPAEAAAMRRFMQDVLGLAVRWEESDSYTTRLNAQRSARILQPEGIDDIILVTSSLHMTRAAAEFAAAGFHVTAAPAQMWTRELGGVLGFLPSVEALSRSHDTLYEWGGRLVQRWRAMRRG